MTEPLAGRRITLVSSGHLATNPRIVKEADALHGVGAQVTVVSAPFTQDYKPLDAGLMRTRHWRHLVVDVTREASPFAAYALRAAGQRWCAGLPESFWRLPHLAEAAFSATTARLSRALQALPRQDLLIAHNLAALPAAARAAQRSGAKLGFDLEDCHWGEFPDGDDSRRRRLVRWIEDRYLPQCVHLTAASPLIAEHYSQRLKRSVTTALNVFPIDDRPESLRNGPPPRKQRPLSLYWFSQTIGPDRGLEWVVDALHSFSLPIQLTLRGRPVSGYPGRLRERSHGGALSGCIFFEPLASPDGLVSACADHDIGLSVEDGESLNRRLCLPNKIFHYLLAGLPVVLSDTPAQQALGLDLGEAAAVVNRADPTSLQNVLEHWLQQPQRLAAVREQAWRLAGHRYNWDREQAVFLNAVRESMEWV